jgi:xylose isomerase
MKIAASLYPWTQINDRFMSKGYYIEEKLSTLSILDRIAELPDVDGVELNYIQHLDEKNVEIIKNKVKEIGLEISGIGVPISGESQWTWGSFTSPKKESRQAAINRVKNAMDLAKENSIKKINLWNGQDGYDYPLEIDYEKAYFQLITGIIECAEHQQEVQICLEYKLNEPRKRLINSTIGKCLYLVNKVNKDNVGVLLDYGHSYQARENPAESLFLAAKEQKLFHVHFNDNYGFDDDDMIVGSIHFYEYIDFIYWLKRMKYNEWSSLDIFPIREDSNKAVSNSIYFLRKIEEMVESIGIDNLTTLINEFGTEKMYKTIWKELFS